MRIQKGKPRFSQRELWNFGDELADIIREGLIQFKNMERNGYPIKAIFQYLKETKGYSEEKIKELLTSHTQQEYTTEEVFNYFNTLLDKMIFAFSKNSLKHYHEIEEPIEVNSLTDKYLFTEEELKYTFDEKTRTTRILFKPKEGYTEEDVEAYNQRSKEYEEDRNKKIEEGLNLFSIYMYSLWD